MSQRSAKVEIYRSSDFVAWDEVACKNVYRDCWRWRMRASNGRIVAESGEGYLEPRNLVRGLEIAHPGWLLAWSEKEQAWAMALDAWSFPVTVPAGTESLWSARRKR